MITKLPNQPNESPDIKRKSFVPKPLSPIFFIAKQASLSIERRNRLI